MRMTSETFENSRRYEGDAPRVGTWRRWIFDDFEEYLDRAANPVHKTKKYNLSSGFGAPDYAEHIRKAREGDPALLEGVESVADALFADISAKMPTPETTYDKSGAFWDLDRVMTNDPDCWIDYEPSPHDISTRPGGNLVRLTVNTAASASCYNNSHRNRTGAIVAVCRLLELAGYRVQFETLTALYVHASYHEPIRFYEFRAVTKQVHQETNAACVAYWCSREMERRVDFSICETIPPLHEYASPACSPDPGDIYFGPMHADEVAVDWNNLESVKKWLYYHLQKQGIVLGSD